ncbi:hypothetical protein C8F04DRAFT_1254360 [Mycena alexandri]|uniref:Uncharacterized protein n=1 Tax=Mycena alexandri TaxID=1745969 RepID=A0AAD6T690_9AGAR|nr:hypothetical protein C8F04DRAFT_1254360 [Mycena alexandri]
MVPNACREMVLYQPVYKPGAMSDNGDLEVPALISDKDWAKHIAHTPLLAYDVPIMFLSCNGSYVPNDLKKKKSRADDWDVGERERVCTQWHSASTSSCDLQKGERYADLGYIFTKITETVKLELTYNYNCEFICACACHKAALRAKL